MSDEVDATTQEARPSPTLQSRRRFLIALMAAVGAGWIGAILHRLFVAAPRNVQPVGVSLTDLPAEGLLSITYAGKPVLLRRGEEGEVEAISLVCTHLGCTVEWQPENQQFYCPCHEGKFDGEGRAVSGPPKLSLERLKVRREGDKVWVGEPL
mgnify:CR=1 FL=1